MATIGCDPSSNQLAQGINSAHGTDNPLSCCDNAMRTQCSTNHCDATFHCSLSKVVERITYVMLTLVTMINMDINFETKVGVTKCALT